MLPTKFQVSWPFGSEEAKINWISDQTILAIFDLQVNLMLPSQSDASYQVSSQLAFWFRKCETMIFKMVAILDFPSKQF